MLVYLGRVWNQGLKIALNRTIATFIENIGEATTACLTTTALGNLAVTALPHWLIASQTAIVAGTIASLVILVARASKRWTISVVLEGGDCHCGLLRACISGPFRGSWGGPQHHHHSLL